MSLSDLKPCPFCGGDAEQRPVRDGTKTRCNRCSADVVAFNGPDDPGGRKRSAEQWNRRAEKAPVHPCTCHPDDSPPVPCARKYALSECLAARAEGVAALQQAGEPSISTDGPHNIGDHRRWLARQLLDSQLSDREALRIVAYSPALEGYLPQQTALVEKGVEKIIAQHEPAACGASAPSEAPRSAGWQDISSAPRDGTTIQARIPGHGSDNMIAWISDALDDGNGSCGAWTFVLEDQEPPSCWSDGWCWAVNEDGERSAEPTEWKAATPPADGGEG